MTDSTGTRFHFTVAADMAEVVELEFYLTGGTELQDVSGGAFVCRAVSRTREGVVVEVPVQHGESAGRIELHVPAMTADAYDYEVYATDSAGGVSAVVYGVLTATSTEFAKFLVAEADEVERRRLAVEVAEEEGRPRMVRWQASSVAGSAAQEAVDAANKAEEYAGMMSGAVDLLKQAQEFIASFYDAVRKVIFIGSNGNWYIAGEDSGMPSQGANGITPHIGEDGYWYVGETCLERKACGEDGLTPYIGANGHWCIGAVDTGVPARGRDGLDGTAVRRILVAAYEEIPWTGETCNGGFYYYVPNEEEYDVYAWLEPDGWVRVGLANDIATKEVYGLVKLGTDNVAEVGAPVAVNEEHEMTVPQASTAVYGSAKISTSATMGVNTDGAIGLTEDGKLRAEHATADRFGTIKPSRPDSLAKICSIGVIPPNTIVDGTDRAGLLGSTPALKDTYGQVKCAYQFTTFNGIEYLVPMGVRMDATSGAENTNSNWYWGANGQAGIPLQVGGALRWVSTSSESRDGKAYSTGGRMELRFSQQFSSSDSLGLTLESATTDMLSGVYIATGLDDTRVNAVPNAATVLAGDNGVVAWANATFRRLDDSYSSSEVDGFLSQVYKKAEVDGLLGDYATKAELADLERRSILKTPDWTGDVVLSEEEYNRLAEKDDTKLYIIV